MGPAINFDVPNHDQEDVNEVNLNSVANEEEDEFLSENEEGMYKV